MLVWICRFPLALDVWEVLRFVIVALPGLFSYLITNNCSLSRTEGKSPETDCKGDQWIPVTRTVIKFAQKSMPCHVSQRINVFFVFK